jgi:hypothetical protein
MKFQKQEIEEHGMGDSGILKETNDQVRDLLTSVYRDDVGTTKCNMINFVPV